MQKTMGWIGLVALAGMLTWSTGCADSGGGGPLTLELGNMRDQTIKANGSNDYKYQTTSSGVYTVVYDTVSTGDGATLELVSGDVYDCVVFLDSQDCTTSANLDADTPHEFEIHELSGVETTFRVGPQVGVGAY